MSTKTLTPPKSVKQFGAIGDGTTDDTQAIQKAINNGGDILFEEGVYIISDIINLNSNIKLYSNKLGSVILKFTGQVFQGFVGTTVSNIIFENLVLANYTVAQGVPASELKNTDSKTPTGPAPTTDQVIALTRSNNIRILKCKFNWKNGVGWLPQKMDKNPDFPNGLYGGICFTRCSEIVVDSCQFLNAFRNTAMPPAKTPCSSLFYKNNLLHAIEISNQGEENITVSNNTANWVITFCRVRNANNIRIINNTITDTGDTAIFDRVTSKIPCYNREISNNTLTNIGKSAIKIMDTNNDIGRSYSGLACDNTIENWGIHTISAAILSANHYSGAGTNKAPRDECATNLCITGNTITETDKESCGRTFMILNTVNVQMTDNTVKLLPTQVNPCTGQIDDNMLLQWCYQATIANNTFSSDRPWYVQGCEDITIGKNNVTPAPIQERSDQPG